MMAAHVGFTTCGLTSLSGVLDQAHGRSAVLFAVIAGFSLGIMSGRARPPHGRGADPHPTANTRALGATAGHGHGPGTARPAGGRHSGLLRRLVRPGPARPELASPQSVHPGGRHRSGRARHQARRTRCPESPGNDRLPDVGGRQCRRRLLPHHRVLPRRAVDGLHLPGAGPVAPGLVALAQPMAPGRGRRTVRRDRLRRRLGRQPGRQSGQARRLPPGLPRGHRAVRQRAESVRAADRRESSAGRAGRRPCSTRYRTG